MGNILSNLYYTIGLGLVLTVIVAIVGPIIAG
jgi:hypothetical protein